MSELDQFIDQIINEKDLSGVTDDVRQILHDDLKARLSQQIDSAILDALSEDKMEELATTVDEPNFTPAMIQEFIAASGVNIEQITLETMLRFRSLYLQNPNEPNPQAAAQVANEQTASVDQLTSMGDF